MLLRTSILDWVLWVSSLKKRDKKQKSDFFLGDYLVAVGNFKTCEIDLYSLLS